MSVRREIERRMEAAESRYGAFTSSHEALGVLIEEVDELRDAVRRNDPAAIAAEAADVSAVAERLARQCDRPTTAFRERSGW